MPLMHIVKFSPFPLAAQGIQAASQRPSLMYAASKIRHILAARGTFFPTGSAVELEPYPAQFTETIPKLSGTYPFSIRQTHQFPWIQAHDISMAASA